MKVTTCMGGILLKVTFGRDSPQFLPNPRLCIVSLAPGIRSCIPVSLPILPCQTKVVQLAAQPDAAIGVHSHNFAHVSANLTKPREVDGVVKLDRQAHLPNPARVVLKQGREHMLIVLAGTPLP